MIHCFNVQVECYNVEGKRSRDSKKTKKVPKALQVVLEEFEEPRGLPPKRTHDHRIIMKDGTQAINCRPYRYGALQRMLLKE